MRAIIAKMALPDLTCECIRRRNDDVRMRMKLGPRPEGCSNCPDPRRAI